MNALDFLVDFVALVSRSDDSSTQDASDSEKHFPGYGGSATTPAPTLVAAPFKIRDDMNETRARDRGRHHFPMTPSSSQQSFSTAAGYQPNPNILRHNTFDAPFAVPQGRQIPQTFDQHLQQNPGLGLPYDCGEVHQRFCYEYLPPYTSCHEAGCTVPVGSASWDQNQTPSYRPICDARRPEMRFVLPPERTSAGDFQCRDGMCRCQYAFPRRYYMPDGLRETWRGNEPLCSVKAVDRYNEWAWVGTSGEHFGTR